jgi:hypothetical protein
MEGVLIFSKAFFSFRVEECIVGKEGQDNYHLQYGVLDLVSWLSDAP